MKFTIYSGFYNNINYLNQIWRGIKNQTYTNWEWIITDDFSDNPKDAQILKEFANSHPSIKFVKPRWKKEFYFNPPVEHSTGEIMLVQDVDDYPSPKLLEVYKYHFEKFPHVEAIGCASICRDHSINGKLAFYKQMNHNEYFNIFEATYGTEKLPPLVRSLGDARAYRIKTREPNEFAKKNEVNNLIGDDLLKTFHIEKRGKILFLPRLLHTYTQNSPTSISHAHHSKWEISIKEEKQLPYTIHGENLEYLDSIEHYYTKVFNNINTLIFNPFYLEANPQTFDLWNSSVSSGGKARIKELYFDHKINFNTFSKEVNCVFFEINNLDDIKLLQENIKFYNDLKKPIIIHSCNRDLDEKVNNILSPYSYSWHAFEEDKNILINSTLTF